MSSHEKRTDLFTHLFRREARRQEDEWASRYEKGDGELLCVGEDLYRAGWSLEGAGDTR
jgi:hypothetical protein